MWWYVNGKFAAWVKIPKLRQILSAVWRRSSMTVAINDDKAKCSQPKNCFSGRGDPKFVVALLICCSGTAPSPSPPPCIKFNKPEIRSRLAWRFHFIRYMAQNQGRVSYTKFQLGVIRNVSWGHWVKKCAISLIVMIALKASLPIPVNTAMQESTDNKKYLWVK